MKGIHQLAQHLNMSIGTVSRALNGKPDVNAETRKRVLEVAAEEFGYVPNQSGRALRKGATSVIGFMMQTGSEITGQGDTFFMSVFDGVQTVFARHKLDLVALLCSSQEDPDDYLRRIVARGFADGLILSATRRHRSPLRLPGQAQDSLHLARSQPDRRRPALARPRFRRHGPGLDRPPRGQGPSADRGDSSPRRHQSWLCFRRSLPRGAGGATASRSTRTWSSVRRPTRPAATRSPAPSLPARNGQPASCWSTKRSPLVSIVAWRKPG